MRRGYSSGGPMPEKPEPVMVVEGDCPVCLHKVGEPHAEECLQLARDYLDRSLRAISAQGCSSADGGTSKVESQLGRAGAIALMSMVAFPAVLVWFKYMRDLWEWMGS